MVCRMTPRHAAIFGLAFAAVLAASLPAAAAVGDWASGTKARVRLIAHMIGPDGRLDGAIAVAMPPGWKTYWRNPGTAGVAPVFDFAASRNLEAPEVAFPVPHRLDDGYSVTNVYEGSVTFPFHARVADPARPVEIALTIDLGVCEEVCVPDNVTAHLTVPAGVNDPEAAEIIKEARAELPGPPQPGVFAVDEVVRTGGTDGRPEFRVTATVPPGAEPDLFVAGPDDWAAYDPVLKSRNGSQAVFAVKFSRFGASASTPIAGAHLLAVLAVGGKAIEQTLTLD